MGDGVARCTGGIVLSRIRSLEGGVNARTLTQAAAGFRRLIRWWVLLTLVWPVQGHASDTSGSPMVVIFPESPEDAATTALTTFKLEIDPTSVLLIDAPNPAFIDRLGARLITPDLDDELAGCPPEVQSFSDVLEQADKEISLLKADDAAITLQQGFAAFACERNRISSEQIARYLYLAGVLASLQGRDPVGIFGEMLAIRPDYPFPANASQAVQKGFRKARASLDRRPSAIIRYAQTSLRSLQLFVDGNPQGQSNGRLGVGRHFVQLSLPGGFVVGGAIVTVLPNSADDAVDLPPLKLLPPESTVVLARLQRAVGSEAPDPILSEALRTFLLDEKRPWMVVVAVSPNGGHQALYLGADGQVRSEKLTVVGHARQPESVSTSRVWKPGIPLTIGLGAMTVAAASGYGYFYATYAANEVYVEPGTLEWGKVYFGSGFCGVASGVGLVATLISASVTWKFPTGVYKPKAETAGLQPYLNAAPNAVQLGLVGRW